MIKRYSYLAILLTMVGFWGLISLFAKEPPNKRKFVLSKIAGEPKATLSNVNNMSMWIQADGVSARNPIVKVVLLMIIDQEGFSQEEQRELSSPTLFSGVEW